MQEINKRIWNKGYKAATLKFYPELVAAEFMVDELSKKIEGKNAVIIIRDETIKKQEGIIFSLERKNKNKNLALWIGIPSAFIIGGIVTGLIVGRMMR